MTKDGIDDVEALKAPPPSAASCALATATMAAACAAAVAAATTEEGAAHRSVAKAQTGADRCGYGCGGVDQCCALACQGCICGCSCGRDGAERCCGAACAGGTDAHSCCCALTSPAAAGGLARTCRGGGKDGS